MQPNNYITGHPDSLPSFLLAGEVHVPAPNKHFQRTTKDWIIYVITDGTMQTYSPSEYDSDAVIAKGAWQAWNFGPALLDGSGNVLETFNTTKYLNSANPRSAIGCVSAGHYIFVTVDGRNEGYSKGATLSELAAIMSDEGCMAAFNLDGGKSAMMYFNKSIVNAPDGGGRDLSDIIYIGG